jgi:hypothetical protein
MLLSSYTLLIIAFYRLIISIKRMDEKKQSWLSFLIITIFFGLICISVFSVVVDLKAFDSGNLIEKFSDRSRLIILFFSIISLLTFLAIESVYRHEDSTLISSVEQEAAESLLHRTLKWFFMPVFISVFITGLTYVLSGYTRSIPNHCTVFGVYFAVAIVFKQKLEDLKYRS